MKCNSEHLEGGPSPNGDVENTNAWCESLLGQVNRDKAQSMEM